MSFVRFSNPPLFSTLPMASPDIGRAPRFRTKGCFDARKSRSARNGSSAARPVFALPSCQRMGVNTLFCDALGLADECLTQIRGFEFATPTFKLLRLQEFCSLFFFCQQSASPKPHPSKPFSCNTPQTKKEVALQYWECCAAEVALQHWLFCNEDVILTKSCAATSKELQSNIEKAALHFPAAFLRISSSHI